MVEKIINCFEKHNGNYGRIRIKKALEEKDIFVSEAKISRILKENDLVAKVGRKRKSKKNKPTDEQYLSENLVKDKFEERMPNILWCTDLSEMQCRNHKIYVSAIIDVASRRIVSAMVEKHSRQELVQETIKMACCQTKIPKGAFFIVTEVANILQRRLRNYLRNTGLR